MVWTLQLLKLHLIVIVLGPWPYLFVETMTSGVFETCLKTVIILASLVVARKLHTSPFVGSFKQT